MYADVVVLTYQAPDINYFTYLVPKNLEKEIKVGQLVEVPFGKRNPIGIVTQTFDKDSPLQRRILSKIKPIRSVAFSTPILLPYQVELLKWMSTYYLAPMVNCLEAMLPTAALNVKRLTANAKLEKSFSPSSLGVSQSIILVPTINRIPQALAQFPKAKNYAIYHNELKTGEKFATWLKIISGNVDFIFGSRSAIFTPCPNLTQIKIYDEHETVYKDERSPYFCTLTVAEKISKLTGAQIQIVDPSPKISTYFLMPKNTYITQSKIKYHIVSMQNERLMQNFGPISDSLLSHLKKNAAGGKNSLLFLNKKKEVGVLFCKDCKNSQYLEKQPESCPNCQSSDFNFNVLNISSLAQEVKSKVPSAKINLMSEDTRLSSDRQSTIDIATAAVFYAPLVKKYDLVAHIQTDTLINRADFSSNEILFNQITDLKKLLKIGGSLILQTYNPDQPVLKAATHGNYLIYYENQLNQRRLLAYPPFGLLIKLTLKGWRKEQVEEKAQQLSQTLKANLLSLLPFTILGPYQPIFFSKQTTYNIILKCKLNSYTLEERQKTIEKLSPILRKIERGWQITVEPESIN